MARFTRLFIAMLCAFATQAITAQSPALYSTVEIDPFFPAGGVAFSAQDQGALVEDIAREITVTCPTVIILHQGETIPPQQAVLRISGTITEFNPGSRLKRRFIGFGAGAAQVTAQVRFSDLTTGRVLYIRQFQGMTRLGAAEGDSQDAENSLAKKIKKFCNSTRLIASN